MHRANLVEREIGRAGSPQTTPAKRVVSASRFAKRDPTATSAKRPRRNARRSTAFVANERGQRKAPRSVVLRRDDSLVANPTRTRINQLERRLDDAPQRPPFSVRLRFQLSPSGLCGDAFARAALPFQHCTAKNAAPQATERSKSTLERKNCEKKNRVRAFRPFPTPSISGIMRNGGILRRRTDVKPGKIDKTARFLGRRSENFFAPTFASRRFLAEKSFFRTLFFTDIIKITPFEERFPRTIPRNPTERTLKWPILRT